MPRLLPTLVTTLACAAWSSQAADHAPLVHDTTTIALFNGRDLTGWHVFDETTTSSPTGVMES